MDFSLRNYCAMNQVDSSYGRESSPTQRALDWRVRDAFSIVFYGSNQFR